MQHTRRGFLGVAPKIVAACAMLGAGGLASTAAQAGPGPAGCSGTPVDLDRPTARHYLVMNVRLEEGFEREGGVVLGTRTDLYTLEIRDGRIAQVAPTNTAFDPALPRYDAQGLLLLPALRDMHIHLDKTFYGEPWQAPRRGKTIVDMIEQEKTLIPRLLPESQRRAELLIGLLQSKGTTIARSHCNIDPVSGLKSLEHLLLALDRHRTDFQCEIVTFPQHGLLRAQIEPLMREAMKMGAHYVGGLDPTNVDGRMEASLDSLIQIALDTGTGLDIHLHEGRPSGIAAINYLIAQVDANPVLRGKVTISHAFALAALDEAELSDIAVRLAAQRIAIASTLPLGKGVMPLPQLAAKGVYLMTGTDSVIDHWSPFGTGDMLEKANLYAQLYRNFDEFSLTRALGISTGGVFPLGTDGRRAWPLAGDAATGVLVAASCSAEAVARVPRRQAVFHNGGVVFGGLRKA